MARIDNEHHVFIQLTEDQNYRKSVKKNAPIYRLLFKKELETDAAPKNKKLVSFLNWILRMSEKEYYLTPVHHSYVGVFSLTNKDFGSMVYFRYCTTLTEATKKIFKEKEAIEIVQLHSKVKGSGSKIVNEFI